MKKMYFYEDNAGYGIMTIDAEGTGKFISNESVYKLLDKHTVNESVDFAAVLNDVEDDSSWNDMTAEQVSEVMNEVKIHAEIETSI